MSSAEGAANAAPARFAPSIDQLHARVTAETGSSDFGPDDYLPGLKVLLRSMDEDPDFTPFGRSYAWDTVVSVLKARVLAVQSMAEHSGFDRSPITAPLIITGIPRTGTTALHKLLAVDPRFQGLQTWLTDAPMPRPPRESWTNYDAFHRTAAKLEARIRDAPGKRAAHDMAADEVDECCLILRQGFVSNLWTVGWTSTSYDGWWQGQSEAACYTHHRRCLQLIGSPEPETRWLLKNPGHIATLDDLFATFPDAKVVITHRDPAKAVPSLVSLLMAGRMKVEQGSYADHAQRMMVRETGKWADAVAKAGQVAARYPAQTLDVIHSDFHRAPMETIERIYAFAGMDLTKDVRDAMAARIAEKPEAQHGAHLYDIADFGMSEGQVRERFADYTQRFGLAA